MSCPRKPDPVRLKADTTLQAVRRRTGPLVRGCSDAGWHTIAASGGMLHVQSGQRSDVPPPPYFGSSLDHCTCH